MHAAQKNEDDIDFLVVNSHGVDYLGGNVSFESFSSLGVKAPLQSLKATLIRKNKGQRSLAGYYFVNPCRRRLRN